MKTKKFYKPITRKPSINKMRFKQTIMNHLYGRSFMQRIFRGMHKHALVGMGIEYSSDMRENGEFKVLGLINGNNPVIFDVGANIGEWSGEVLKKFDKVRMFAFEPSAKAYAVLTENIKDSRITIFNMGMNDIAGDKPFYTVSGSNAVSDTVCGSLFKRRVPGMSFDYSGSIKLTTIDDFCLQNSIGKIDFLKIDVEGNELNVLKGAAKMIADGTIKHIQFETGVADSRLLLRDFYDILPNYRICRIIQHGLSEMGDYHEKLEIFGYANYLAILK